MHLNFSEFKQYGNQDSPIRDYEYLDFKQTTEVKLPFSVRASREVELLLCKGNIYNDDNYTSVSLCYAIIIGGWSNSMSFIRKYEKGLPRLETFPPKDQYCEKTQTYFAVNRCI